MRFGIWSLGLAFHDLFASNTLSSVRTGYQKECLTCLACFRESRTKFCDPLFFPSVSYHGLICFLDISLLNKMADI